MKKVAVYARFSSDMQRTESITAQVRACKITCGQKNYEVIKVYADEARTGRNDKREQFQQMIKDSALGIFDIVMVHKLDRFSRDPSDTLYYTKVLRQNKVELISVTESFDGTPEGEMMKMVILGINQYVSLNMSREVRKGLKENAVEALSTGGRGPMGFDIIDKQFVINEKEAEAVKLIFSMYDSGNGYMTIINKLNSLGYKTKKGLPFSKNSLYEILRNPKYYGCYVYNRACSADIYGKRSPHRHKSLDEQIIVENGVPAIIDEELWQRVQEKMDKNKRLGGSFKAKKVYLLSGKIRCGICHSAYHGNFRRPDPNREYYSYRCCNRDMKGDHVCHNREIKKEDIEAFVLSQIERFFFSDSLIPTLTKNLNAYIQKTSQSANSDKILYESRLKELKQSRENIVNAVAQSGFAEVFSDKLKQLESEIAMVSANLSLVSITAPNIVVTEDMVKTYFSKFSDYVKAENTSQLKQIVDSYVDMVEIFPEHVTVSFKVAFDFDASQPNKIEYRFEKTADRAELKAS